MLVHVQSHARRRQLERNDCERNWILTLWGETFSRPSWPLIPRRRVSLFSLYDSTIRTLVDKYVPTKDVVNHSHPCSSWFNHRCQATKRATRCLERRYHRKHTADDYRLAHISGRYFRLNTPPTDRQPLTGVLTRGRSGTGWTLYSILWCQHSSPTSRMTLRHFSQENLTPFMLRQ